MSIYKRGGKWWIRFRFNYRRYARCSPENSQAGAKAYETALRHKLANGEPLTEREEIKNPAPTFQEFSTLWMSVYVKTNNKYSEFLNKQCILSAHLLPCFGHKLINKISTSDVENFKGKKIKAGLAPKTINNHLIVLSRCLKVAQEQDDWDEMLKLPRIKLLKVKPQKFDSLTEAECQLLLDNCDGILKAMILIALKTGLRFGELTALEWNDVDFVNNHIIVAKAFSRGKLDGTKSNKIRYIPMIDEISQLLYSRVKDDGYIFTRNGNQPLGHMLCLRRLHRLCKKVGMRNIGWHTFRHTFASHLAQKGVSIMNIKELLGHADIRTSLRYSHLNPSVIREAIKVLECKSGYNMGTISFPPTPKAFTLAPAQVGYLRKA